MDARELARIVAIHIVKGQEGLAARTVQLALNDARDDAEPRLMELEAEVAKLRKCLAYHYLPRYVDWKWWGKHCDEIDAAGGTPPDEEEWMAELALAEWERKTKE